MRRIVGTVLGVAALFGAPVAAQAATATNVTMLSDGDFIGQGQARLFHPGNGQITAGGDLGGVSIGVSGGTQGDSYNLEFTAPPGQQLVPGVYVGAQRSSFREAGRPGIDITGSGRGCNEQAGHFEVKEYVLGPDGTVTRLWIVYVQHCEGGVSALFGDVRINMPVPDGAPVSAPAILRWPVGESARQGSVQPVSVLAPGDGFQPASVSLGGANPGDFTVRSDECSGRSVAAGGFCQVFVRFTPTAPGTRTAVLRVADAAGRAVDVPLEGWTHGGTTHVAMQSDQGDYIGAGQTYDYTPANAIITAGGTRSGVVFTVRGDNGDDWTANFVPPQGDILAPGRYAPATRYPFQGPGAGLDVSGNGRGCNQLSGEFTVTEATFEPDGELRSFGATLEQHCEHATPALRATFEFRRGDDVPPAPWLVSGVGGPALPPGGGGTGTPGTGGGEGEGAGSGGGPPNRSSCSGLVRAASAIKRGSGGKDSIRGSKRAELFFGGRGNDRVRAGGGADCADGGIGNDRLDGGSGEDMLMGGPGRDVLIGGSGEDVLVCGRGRDVAYVGPGDTTMGCERKIRVRR